MNFTEEIRRDLDFRRPRVIITDELVILENVSGIVMLSSRAITVSHGLKNLKIPPPAGRQVYTTVTGQNLVIREICEGRLLIGGIVEKTEFLRASELR